MRCKECLKKHGPSKNGLNYIFTCAVCGKRLDEDKKPEAVKSKSNDGLDGVLAEAKRGFVDAKQMRKQFKESGHVNKEEFWRGEAMGFFKIITFIEKAI